MNQSVSKICFSEKRKFFYLTLIGILTVCSFSKTECTDLRIIPLGDDLGKIYATLNDSFVMSCISNTISPKDLRWRDPSKKFIESDPSSRVHTLMADDSLGLFFDKFLESDLGTYTCFGKKESESYKVKVSVFSKEEIELNSNPEQLAIFGVDHLVKCKPHSIQDVDVSFFKKGTKSQIQENNKYKITREGLLIKKVDLYDEGVYICMGIATQTGEYKLHEVKITVISPPRWKFKQDNIEYIREHNLTFKCDAFAIPSPVYSWFKNGKSIQDNRFLIINNTLKVNNLKLDDAGNYSCLAENNLGRIENNFTLTVLSVPEIYALDNVTVVEGDSASLECYVKNSIPQAQLRWKYSDESKYLLPFKNPNIEIINKLEQGDELSRNSGDKFSKLLINKVSRLDERNYMCLAKNKVGTVHKIVRLSVEYKPSFTLNSKSKDVYFSWLVENSNNLEFEYAPVEISCMVEGNPVPTINWYFKNELINIDNNTYELLKVEPKYSKLKIQPKSIDDFGTYKCIPENKHGMIEQDFKIKFATKPKSIPKISVKSVYSTSIILEIYTFSEKEYNNEENNLPIDAYKLQWILANSTWAYSSEITYYLSEKDFSNSNRIVKAVIEPLIPDTEYIFKAASMNKAGVGIYTPTYNMIKVKTLPLFISKIVLAFMIIGVFILLMTLFTMFFYVLSKFVNYILFRIRLFKKYERLIVRV